MAGPPPWALALPSPSGTGHLCCSLQNVIEQRTIIRLGFIREIQPVRIMYR